MNTSSPILDFADRLSTDWKQLADALELSFTDRRQLEPGREAQAIVEWLRARQRLEDLPDALEVANRKDLRGVAQRVIDAAQVVTEASMLDNFIASYRKRLSCNYERWELQSVGVNPGLGGRRPVVAHLDEMYLPLRFAEGVGMRGAKRGGCLHTWALLNAKRPIILRGSAGAGKTTWMRFAFRAFLRLREALPVMVVLRDLARRWNQPGCVDEARSLDAIIQGHISEHMADVPKGILSQILKDPVGPRVILLIDGWDEVGPLAEELRAKVLGFLRQYPRALVVVTSRPYGEGQPSSSDGFDILDIQPLSDPEIAEFSRRFFYYCYGAESVSVNERSTRFKTAIFRSPESHKLARTPLLLTMMLFISRTRPLPEKRHQLYRDCIDNLLTALPDQKEGEGALHSRRLWRPSDGEERLRVAAGLAAAIHRRQETSSKRSSAAPLSIDELVEMLPPEWPRERPLGQTLRALRIGYVYWLSEAAGLLTERADGLFTFSHLSFQEYLTAWHLNATVEGAGRIEVLKELAGQDSWTEVFRLFAAAIGGQSEERLDAVFEALLLDGRLNTLYLAGMFFADGLGTDVRFNQWRKLARHQFFDCPINLSPNLILAWTQSTDLHRKEALLDDIRGAAENASLLAWLDLGFRTLRITHLPLPNSLLAKSAVTPIGEVVDRLQLAAGRVLAFGLPLWPSRHKEVGLLNLWPSARRIAGIRLQLAACCGANEQELIELARTWSVPAKDGVEVDQQARNEIEFDRELWTKFRGTSESPPYGWEGLCSIVQGRSRVPTSAMTSSDFEPSTLPLLLLMPGPGADNLAAAAAAAAAEEESTSDSASGYGRDGLWQASLMLTLADVEDQDARDRVPANSVSSKFGQAVQLGTRGFGVHAGRYWAIRSGESDDLSRLMIQASCLSLKSELSDDSFVDFLMQVGGKFDPLWLALARHLARRSTDEDRRLLVSRVSEVDGDDTLSLGLRYIVRGDIVLADGSEVTLDELAIKAGVPTLPMLDEMAEELVVAFSDAKIEDRLLKKNNPETEDLPRRNQDVHPAGIGGRVFDPEGATLSSAGYKFYSEQNFPEAAESFWSSFLMGDVDAGNNLAYMIRRREAVIRTELAWEELLAPSMAGGLQFAAVNLALGRAGGYPCLQSWDSADEIIRMLRPETGVVIDKDVVSWWSALANEKGEAEGHLVIGWLVRHGIIDDPDLLSVAQRMNVAAAGGWDIPEWMKCRN